MIGQVLTSLWTTVAQPIWELMKTALRALGDFFAWVWSSLIKPAWDGLAAGIKWAWENVIRPAWDALKTALQAVGAFLRVGLELTQSSLPGTPRSWHLVGVAERDPPRLGRTARCPAGAG
ncbi:hypothetical protein GS452_07255 [Rhodococcus hoagii]|nr:hypothetical protein [Prescottella equi]